MATTGSQLRGVKATTMDVERCARISWALTKNFSAESGDTQQLVDLRLALAEAVYRVQGEGYPQPATDPRRSEAWNGCVRAAIEADQKQVAGTLSQVRV